MSGLEQLYLSMRGGIACMVSRIVPPDDVEDIVQETYLRICKVAIAEEIRYPRSYVYRTARNLALDSIKRADNARTASWNEDVDYAGARSDAVINQIESNEEFGHFCESVLRLPLQARRVFVLKKVYGFSQREIAADLDISESTVEKHVALAIRRCADHMKRCESVCPEARDPKSSHQASGWR